MGCRKHHSRNHHSSILCSDHIWVGSTLASNSSKMRMHYGTDFTERGSPVWVAHQGVVETATYMKDFGRAVVLNHGTVQHVVRPPQQNPRQVR